MRCGGLQGLEPVAPTRSAPRSGDRGGKLYLVLTAIESFWYVHHIPVLRERAQR